MTPRKIIACLAPVDIVSIVFLLFLIGLNLVFIGRVLFWKEIIVVDLMAIAFVISLAYLAGTKKTKVLIGIHRFYSYLFVLFVFKEIYLMVRPIHPVDYDWLFIFIDRWIFDVDPTQWLSKFAFPLLTEILQISYFSYYILFIILGVELYSRYEIEDFDRGAFLVVYGFYLSYLGYFLLPAVGPRFTLHNFYATNQELPGLLLTPWIRDFVNAGESISFQLKNAADFVQRDVFPSGHTQLTLIVAYVSHKYKLKTRWIITVLGGLLIIGTVYLRYHYVADIFGGILFFFLSIWSGKKIQAWWEKKKSLLE